MARWPWHKTAFYLEWLEDLTSVGDEDGPSSLDPLLTPDALIGMGASAREIT